MAPEHGALRLLQDLGYPTLLFRLVNRGGGNGGFVRSIYDRKETHAAAPAAPQPASTASAGPQEDRNTQAQSIFFEGHRRCCTHTAPSTASVSKAPSTSSLSRQIKKTDGCDDEQDAEAEGGVDELHTVAWATESDRDRNPAVQAQAVARHTPQAQAPSLLYAKNGWSKRCGGAAAPGHLTSACAAGQLAMSLSRASVAPYERGNATPRGLSLSLSVCAPTRSTKGFKAFDSDRRRFFRPSEQGKKKRKKKLALSEASSPTGSAGPACFGQPSLFGLRDSRRR